jgi:hypothetical protein
MNRAKAVLTLSAALLGAAASAPALAWHHGGVRFGVFVGAPFYPWYYPPYYYPYYPPYPVTVPAAPTTYVEQGSAHPEPSQRSYWYYCEASKTYYPYVKECAAGWLRVVPQATPHTAPQSTPQKTPQAAPQTAPG